MPAAILSDASPPAMLKDRPREMSAEEERKRIAVCPTDDDVIAPGEKKHHKQSFEYIWRNFIAGGLAGSAVCLPHDALASKY
jgi:solute carrier family 25 protein 16